MDELPKTHRVERISDQIERAASSAGANYHEANFAVSKADFNNKLGIVIKELNETKFWLKVVVKMSLHSWERVQPEFNECEELLSLFISIRRGNKKEP